MLLKIVQAGDPVLRGRARSLTVDEIHSDAVQQLIELMKSTMRDAPGVGLAAPQIGVSLQVAVIEHPAEYLRGVPEEELKTRGLAPVPFHVLVNPVLTVEDAAPAEYFEGCLSVEGYSALVRRASAVRVEAWNERAEPVTIHAHGWYARILQHEIDHLHGTLYIDHMETRSYTSSRNHSRHWTGMPIAEVRQALRLDPPDDQR